MKTSIYGEGRGAIPGQIFHKLLFYRCLAESQSGEISTHGLHAPGREAEAADRFWIER